MKLPAGNGSKTRILLPIIVAYSNKHTIKQCEQNYGNQTIHGRASYRDINIRMHTTLKKYQNYIREVNNKNTARF